MWDFWYILHISGKKTSILWFFTELQKARALFIVQCQETCNSHRAFILLYNNLMFLQVNVKWFFGMHSMCPLLWNDEGMCTLQTPPSAYECLFSQKTAFIDEKQNDKQKAVDHALSIMRV